MKIFISRNTGSLVIVNQVKIIKSSTFVNFFWIMEYSEIAKGIRHSITTPSFVDSIEKLMYVYNYDYVCEL